MKIRQFAQKDTFPSIVEMSGIRNMVELGGYYYSFGLSNLIGLTQYTGLLKYDTAGNISVAIDTGSITNLSAMSKCTKFLNSKIYTSYTLDTKVLHVQNSADGSTWTNNSYSGWTTDFDRPEVIDIFITSTNAVWYFIRRVVTSSTNAAVFANEDFTTIYSAATSLYLIGGYIESNIYRFIEITYTTAWDNVNLWQFNLTANPTEETNAYVTLDNDMIPRYPGFSLYFKNFIGLLDDAGNRLIISTRDIEGNWTEKYFSTSDYGFSVSWDQPNNRPEWLGVYQDEEYFIYKFFKNGAIEYLQKFANYTTGSKGSGVNGVMHQLPFSGTYLEETLLTTKNSYEIRERTAIFSTKNRRGQIVVNSSDVRAAWEEGDFLEVADANDVICFMGIVTKIQIKADFTATISLRSIFDIELDRDINYIATAESDETIISTILTDGYYCTLSTSGFTANSHNEEYKNTKLKSIIDAICKRQGLINYFVADTQVININAGSAASGITLDSSTGTQLQMQNYNREPAKISEVRAVGGFVAGVRVERFARSSIAGGIRINEDFPNLIDGTELQRGADNILAKKDQSILEIDVAVWNEGFIQAGTQVSLKMSINGYLDTVFNAAANYFVKSCKYSLHIDKATITLTDVVVLDEIQDQTKDTQINRTKIDLLAADVEDTTAYSFSRGWFQGNDFRGETVATTPTGWSSGTIVGEIDGHKNVLNNGTHHYPTIPLSNNDFIEICYWGEFTGSTNDYCQLKLFDGSNEKIMIIIDYPTNTIQCYDSAAYVPISSEFTQKTWHHIKIQLLATTDELNVWIDGVDFGVFDSRYSYSQITAIRFSRYTTTLANYYIDALDYSGAVGYYEGRNYPSYILRNEWKWRSPSANDFTVANFTDDSTWRNLDLSGVVPAGTRVIKLYLQERDTGTAYKFISFRRNSTSTAYFCPVYVANQYVPHNFTMEIDVANCQIQYNRTGLTNIDVKVVAYK